MDDCGDGTDEDGCGKDLVYIHVSVNMHLGTTHCMHGLTIKLVHMPLHIWVCNIICAYTCTIQ